MHGLDFDIAHMLAGLLVLVSLAMLYQDRLYSLINALALHALVLAASVAWQARIQDAPHLYITALIAGTTQLSAIAEHLQLAEVGLRVSLALALIGFIIVAIAENARIPVDNPATHLELTMVHEAMVLEYSGRYLAMIDLAAALKLLMYASLIACVFCPWGLAPPGSTLARTGLGMAAWAGKMAVAGTALALFETIVAKMRVFRVPDFLGIALMLGLLGTLLLFVSRSL